MTEYMSPINQNNRQSSGTGPVGEGNHIVKQGDCIESIAANHGLFWETVWNHPNNQQLKRDRKNPNILLPGDKVFVPNLRIKREAGATKMKHRFKKKGVPSEIKVILEDEKGNPRVYLDYVIEIDGKLSRGKTDGKSVLEQQIPPNAKKGKLIIGSEGEEYDLRLGNIDPISEITGIQSRLKNLDFNCEISGKLDDETREAIRAFQKKYGLNDTGEPDDPTKQKLEQEHAS